MQELDSLTGREVAVIGMSGRFPRARDLGQFWRNLRDGVEAVTFFTEEELAAAGVEAAHLQHPNYVRAASLLDDVEQFDASFFGYNAREAEVLDPQQRVFLEVAWHALEDAGYSPQDYKGLIGVYAGAAWNTYLLSNLTTHLELFDGGGAFNVFIASDKDFMPTRAAYKFNLKGPCVIVQTSCSTSLVAIHLAALSLLNYECDIALAGGVTIKVPQRAGYFSLEGGLASPDGHCRPFDAGAQGTIFGSGAGVVVLKLLSEALKDGDHVRAVIKSSAINNDGSAKVSYTAPSVEGQAQVVAAALEMAGFSPETVRYVETHGTGTSLGDPVEVAALTKVFRRSTRRRQFCALGSVKSNIGHLDAAAGVAGFIKTVLALENRELPPSINFAEPNPTIDFAESPFYVNAKLSPWEADGAPRRAGVSSFGVGGTNAHVLLEEAPAPPPPSSSRPWQLLTLSARSGPALEAATAGLLSWLRENPGASLPDVAYTLAAGRSVFRHRRVVVCRDGADAVAALEAEGGPRALTGVDVEEPRDLPVVFLFPGQGSQYVGMARGLYEGEPAFRQHFDECERLLRPHLGLDLRSVVYPDGGTEADAATRLEQTRLAQPALFAVEYALARLWESWGVRPAAMLGHSVGEYVAACVAGVMTLEEAAGLVAARGRLMQRLPGGRMLAVALPEDELAPLLPEGISLAAVNEPSSCVVSGPTEETLEFEDELTRRGVGFRRLHTSHAFHSAMMEPALDEFAAEVRRVSLRPPQTPFVSGLTGNWITPDEATDPNYWVRQMREPVRFSRGLCELLGAPERVFLEVGPGRTLTTLAARHEEGRGRTLVSSIRHPKEEAADLAALLESVGRLWLAGVKVDWREFYRNERRRRLPLPGYPFERQRFWVEPRARRTGGAEAEGGPTVAAKKADLSEWFYLPSWKPSLPPRPAGEGPRRWLLLADEGEFAAALAARLSAGGRELVRVEAGEGFRRLEGGGYAVRPGAEEDYGALLEDLQARDFSPEVVVHAFGLTGESAVAGGAAQFEAYQQRGFYSLLFLLQALTRRAQTPVNLQVVCDRALAAAADDAPHPEKAPLLGLCRVAGQELAGVTSRFIDVALPEGEGAEVRLARLADALILEGGARSSDRIVAYREGRRYVQGFEPVRLDAREEDVPLREGGVYLLTGGLAGDGFAVAAYLARTCRARLVLVEPTPLAHSGGNGNGSAPPRQSQAGESAADARPARLQALKEAGAEVFLAVADAADPRQLKRAWLEAEAHFGAVHGVVHADEPGGDGAFRAIWEAEREGCEPHFRAKAHVAYALEEILKEREVDFCVLLSSIASVLGGVGYAAYASANLFLDSFARRANRAGGSQWLSLGRDLWLGEGGGDLITGARGDLSELGMTPREGEEAFRRALTALGCDHVIVSTADLAARLRSTEERFEGLRAGRAGAAGESAAVSGPHPRPSLPTPYVAPETETERRIAAVWQQVLGFEAVGVEDNFFDLGGDSLVAIQVAAHLKQELKTDFPVAKLYQGLTVRALARLLTPDGDGEQERRAARQAELTQAAARRMEYIERRGARARRKES